MFENMNEAELVSLAVDKDTEIKVLLLLSLHELESVRVAVAGNSHTPGLAFEYLIKDTSVEVAEALAFNLSLPEPFISQLLGMHILNEDIVEGISYTRSLSLANMKAIAEKYPHLVKNFIGLPDIPEEIILPYFYSVEEELVKNPEYYNAIIFALISNRNTPLNILGKISSLGIKYRVAVVELVRISQPMIKHLTDDELIAFISE